MQSNESIHSLFHKVIEHPDFAGGTIFTREDIADALEINPDEVTARQLWESQKIIQNYIFNGIYSWDDAIKDNVNVV